jgi:hypothetical protein
MKTLGYKDIVFRGKVDENFVADLYSPEQYIPYYPYS